MSTCSVASARLLIGLVAAVGSTVASADPSPALDRVSLWLGGYYANSDLSLAARTRDGEVSTGHLDLESGRETVGRARADVLLFDNQGFTFDVYTLSHSRTQTLTQPFSYEGVPYELDSSLRGKLDFTSGSASYHFWFGGDNDVFGIGLGASYYRAKLGIQGTASAGGQSGGASARWDEDAVAPLLTLAYKHAFSDSLRVYLDASGVQKNGGTLSGHIYDARLGVEWFPWHSVGVGAEYGATRVHLDREGNTYGAKVDVDLDGPSLFARFRF